MPPSASRLLELSDRRDQLVLSMVIDLARVKTKAVEAKRKQARQVGYRSVRYQRFKGRRGDAMEDEVRQAIRARRTKSIQIMAEWLEAQALSNALEGTPREKEVETAGSAPDATSPEKPSSTAASTPIVAAGGQRLITSFLSQSRR